MSDPRHEAVDETEAALMATAEEAKHAGVRYALERISDETVHAILSVADKKNVNDSARRRIVG